MTLLSSSPQDCLKGEGGEIKIILDRFQIVYYDLTISLNIFCEGLQIKVHSIHSIQCIFKEAYQPIEPIE